MTTRADRIFGILAEAGGRLKVADIHRKLAEVEDVSLEELRNTIVSSTVAGENKRRREAGRVVRFKTFGDGEEERGFISIKDQARSRRHRALENYPTQLPVLIEEANNEAKKRLREEIGKLSWREFESNFMAQVLEALGFSAIEITRSTRDGGIDAECHYRRGLVVSKAYVSAKHWKKKVPRDEVERMRGKKGDHDTAIIFTSSSFAPTPIKEAEPVSFGRSMVLIDGNLIVETCFSENIGVRDIALPVLSEFVGFDSDADV